MPVASSLLWMCVAVDSKVAYRGVSRIDMQVKQPQTRI